MVAPWGVPCSGCRVPQLVGRFPPPLYKQLQNIPNQTKAAAQNTLPCSVLRPFFVSSASQLLQDILDLFVGVALLQQLAPDGWALDCFSAHSPLAMFSFSLVTLLLNSC